MREGAHGLSATGSDGLSGAYMASSVSVVVPMVTAPAAFKSRDGCRGVVGSPTAKACDALRPGQVPMRDVSLDRQSQAIHLGADIAAVVTIHVGQFPSRGVEPQVAEHAEARAFIFDVASIQPAFARGAAIGDRGLQGAAVSKRPLWRALRFLVLCAQSRDALTRSSPFHGRSVLRPDAARRRCLQKASAPGSGLQAL